MWWILIAAVVAFVVSMKVGRWDVHWIRDGETFSFNLQYRTNRVIREEEGLGYKQAK